MIRQENFPFQVDRPTFVRVPFTANGRQWAAGDHFPWKELSIDDDKVRILYNQRTLFHNSAKEVGAVLQLSVAAAVPASLPAQRTPLFGLGP